MMFDWFVSLFTYLWNFIEAGWSWSVMFFWEIWHWCYVGIDALWDEVLTWGSQLLPAEYWSILNDQTWFNNTLAIVADIEWFVPMVEVLNIYIAAHVCAATIHLGRHLLGLIPTLNAG